MVAPFFATHSGAALRVADFHVVGAAGADDFVTFSSPLTRVVTDELNEAREVLGLEAAEILLAALGGAIARTIGEGVVGVDVSPDGVSVLPISLRCEHDNGDRATEILVAVHRAVVTASLLDARGANPSAEVAFVYSDAAPSQPPVASAKALQLVAYHLDGLLELDWHYDSRQFDRYTIEELAEQLPLALIALTSEAAPPIDGGVATRSRIFAAK